MELQISRRRFLAEALSLLLMFSGIISRYISVLSYLDELVCLFCLFVFARYVIRHRVSKELFFTLCLCLLVLILGLISNINSRIQTNIKPILLDVFAVFKFIPVFWGGIIIGHKIRNRELFWNHLAKIVRVFMVFAFIFSILNLLFDVHMYTDYRFGLRSFNFIYSRVGGLYSGCAVFLMIQLMDFYHNGVNKKKELYVYLTMLVMCSTLRTRAFVFAAVFFIGYYIIMKNKKFKIKFWHIVLIIAAIVLISYTQIRTYFIDNDEQARGVLLKYGVQTAKRYFPLGAGFGTYGTNAAKEYYSPLYLEYGFQSIYGLGKVKNTYLTDTYWPALMGEFGFAGSLCMGGIIFLLFKKAYSFVKNNKVLMFAVLYGLGVVLLSSFATASFMTSTINFFLSSIAISEVKNGDNKWII